jgi:UDP-N-acetylmuramate dehydrogenase
LGNGRFEDMIYLINLAKRRVYEKFGITLKEEIKIIF